MSEDLLAFVSELQSNPALHTVFVQQPFEVLHEYDLGQFDADYVLNLVNNAPVSLDAGHLSLADDSGSLVSGLGASATVGSQTVSAILPDGVVGSATSDPTALLFGAGEALPALPGLDALPAVPGLDALPALPGLDALPALPGLDALPALPGLDALPALPGLDALPAVPGLDALPAVPGLDALPAIPGLDALPELPGLDALPAIPGLDTVPGLDAVGGLASTVGLGDVL